MVDGTCSFPTYPKELQCTGNESALIDCTRNGTANRTCDCDQYAVVNCCKLPVFTANSIKCCFDYSLEPIVLHAIS